MDSKPKWRIRQDASKLAWEEENRSMLLVHMDQRCCGAGQLQSCWICFHCWHALLCDHQAQCCYLRQKWSWRGWNVSCWPKQTKKRRRCKASTKHFDLGGLFVGMKVSPSSFRNPFVCGLVVRACFVFTSQPFLRDHRRSTDARLFKDSHARLRGGRSRRLHHCHQAGEPHRQTCARRKWSWPICDRAEPCFSVSTVSSLFHVRRLCGCRPWCCWFGKPGSLFYRSMDRILSSTLGSRSRMWKMFKCGEYDLESRAWIFLTLRLCKKLLISLPGAHSTVHCGAGCWFSCATDRGRDLRGYAAAHRWKNCPGAASWALLLLWTGINLDQRIAEHERRIQEDRLPEQVAEQTEGCSSQQSVKKADTNSELWTVHEMAWPTSIYSWTSGNHYFKVLLCRQPDTKSSLWQALTRAVCGMHQKASIDFAAVMFVYNWLFRITWIRPEQDSKLFLWHLYVSMQRWIRSSWDLTSSQTKQHYCLRHTFPCVEVLFLLCWLGNRRALHKKRLASSLTENITTDGRSSSPVRGSVVPAKSHQHDDHETWPWHPQGRVRPCRAVRRHDHFSTNWDGGCFSIHDEVQSSCFTRENVLGIVAWAKRFRCARGLFQPSFISWSYRLTRRLFCSCFCFQNSCCRIHPHCHPHWHPSFRCVQTKKTQGWREDCELSHQHWETRKPKKRQK